MTKGFVVMQNSTQQAFGKFSLVCAFSGEGQASNPSHTAEVLQLSSWSPVPLEKKCLS